MSPEPNFRTVPINPPDPKPSGGGGTLNAAWESIRGAPRWVYVAIIIGGIALYYGFNRIKPSGKSKEGIEGLEGDGVFSPISNREGEFTEELAYWSVEVAPAGWASTLNGIATQFYGNTNKVGDIQQANPNITQKPYEKLPTGLKVKVPR